MLLINTLFLLFVCIFPVGQWLTSFLERRFPENPLIPENIEGIIVLGNGFDLLLSYKLNRPCYNSAIGRLISFSHLIKQYPNVKHVFTGGGRYLDLGVNESVLAEKFFQECSLNTQQIIFERESRNTNENVLYSYHLLHPKRKWVLVTSALHMPRAVRLFKKIGWEVIPFPIGWEVIPFPVDYHSEKKWSFFNFNLSRAIVYWRTSMHEIVNIIFGYFKRQNDTLIPKSEG